MSEARPQSLIARYRALVASGEAQPDPAQAYAAEALQLLDNRLQNAAQRGFTLAFWRRQEPPRGLYLYGGVGRGKTWLMDLFFATTAFAPKRRVHFHDFMLALHADIAGLRADGDGDALPHAADRLAAGAALLCLDELHVRDVADAAILARLFERLWQAGVVVVATSNTHPQDLYAGGIAREHVLPFIAGIETHMDIVELEAAHDYRAARLADMTLYATPLGAAADAAIDATWARLTGGEEAPATLALPSGRRLEARRAGRGAGRFTFGELCSQPLGAEDYRAIAHAFDIVVLEHVPQLTAAQRNETQRLITLIDMLYDHGTRLIVSAAAEPGALLAGGPLAASFERTASRMLEMRAPADVARLHQAF